MIIHVVDAISKCHARGSHLLHVTDLFAMGAALVLESLVLFKWCESKGYGPLGISGISMGGHMASLASGFYDKPVSVIPCMSSVSSSLVFVDGLLNSVVDWKGLEKSRLEVSQ